MIKATRLHNFAQQKIEICQMLQWHCSRIMECRSVLHFLKPSICLISVSDSVTRMFCGRGGGWKCFQTLFEHVDSFWEKLLSWGGCAFLLPFVIAAKQKGTFCNVKFFTPSCSCIVLQQDMSKAGKSDWGCVAQLFAKCVLMILYSLRDQSLMTWIELKCCNYYFSRMFYYFYIPLEKSHSMRAKKKNPSANMDYGVLDIGRDKANHILCLFLPKNGLDSCLFYLPWAK